MNCKNHPSTPTKRKCYHCKSPICSICQVRGSHHIFCSDECHELYQTLSPKAKRNNSQSSKGEKLVPGTPHVDAAYSEEISNQVVKNINMETFEAIQDVVAKTDKELKSYLKDLEIIFESSNQESLLEIKGFFEKKWTSLDSNVDRFRKSVEDSSGSLQNLESEFRSKHHETISSFDKVSNSVSESFREIGYRLSKLDTEVVENIPDKVTKVSSSLDSLSSSVDEKVFDLKSLLTKQADKISVHIKDSQDRFSQELTEGIGDLDSKLSEDLTSIKTSIDSAKLTEKELLDKNESKIKELIEHEKSYVSSLFTDYNKKFNHNLSTNKDRISKSIHASNTEIKDFLDFQKTELTDSVSKLAQNLEDIFKKADSSFTSIGLGVNKTLEESLKVNSDELNKDIDAFEKGLEELLDVNRKAVEDYLSALEDEQRSLLEKFQSNLGEELEGQKGHFENSLATQAKLVNTLLDTTQKDFDSSLKIQNSDIKETLTDSSSQISTNLSSIGQEIKGELDSKSTQISESLSTVTTGIKDSMEEVEFRLGKYITDHKEKVSEFIEDSFTSEKAELKRLIGSSQLELQKTVEKLSTDVSSSNELNKEQIENSVKAKISEIDGIIQNEILEVQKRLDKSASQIEEFNKNTVLATNDKLLTEFKALERRVNDHHEKRGKIMLDEMACLVVSNKGNMEEILNKAKTDIDAQIAEIEKKSATLLKNEIGKTVDVFNLNLSGLLGEIKENLKKRIKAIPTQFSLSPSIKAVIVVLLLIAVLNPIIVYIYSNKFDVSVSQKIDDLAQRIDKIDKGRSVVGTVKKETKLKKPKLSIEDGFTTKNRNVSLNGTANGDFVMLSVNKKPQSLSFIKKGSFRFNGINLNQGENTLSITAYSENGSKSPSDLKRIYYRKGSKKIYNLTYNIARGDLRKPYISITFDGGSNALAAPFILDTLKKKGIKTTMFLTGHFMEQNPELTKKIVAYGHEVGNHSYSHPHFIKNFGSKKQRTSFTKRAFQSELRKTAKTFTKITGRKLAPYWRAPYGEINDDLLTWAKNAGYTHVGWTTHKGKTMDSLDWVEMEESKLYRTSEEIKSTILNFDGGTRGGSNGSIIIMHLGSNRTKDQPFSKLGEIIDGMRRKGYRFVKVSEMMRSYGKRVAKK